MFQVEPELRLDVKRRFDWRVFFILWAASILATIAVIPYTLTLESGILANANLPMPLPLLIAIQIGETAILLAVAVALGYGLATRIGIGLPFIEKWLQGTPIWNRLPRTVLFAAVLGLIGGALIVVLDAVFFAPQMAALLGANANPPTVNPPAWQGFLASFYGGITEEVLLRLFVLTLLAWLGHFVSRDAEGRPTVGILWIANIITAVLFGLGHLPATAAIGIPLTPMIITRAILLNGLVGVIAGWLYWTRGLESAMISHFAADMILHVLLPLISPH